MRRIQRLMIIKMRNTNTRCFVDTAENFKNDQLNDVFLKHYSFTNP